MSGRVQKDSADDSDRVDDAVDPRVQVSAAARVCVARTVPLSAYPSSSTSSSRFAILTLSSSARRETSRQRLNRAGRSRVVRRGSNGEFRTPGPIFLRERLLLSPPPSAHARTHTRTNHKTSPFLNPPPRPSSLRRPAGTAYRLLPQQRVLNYPRCPVTPSRREKLEHNASLGFFDLYVNTGRGERINYLVD